MSIKKALFGFAAVSALLSVSIFVGCGGAADPKKTLTGVWETVETSIDRDLTADRVEFLKDGTGMMEAKNIRGVGPWAESFTWRIDDNGRVIISSPSGVTHIYTVIEISKSMLTLETELPGVGNMRTIYSRQGAKVMFELKTEANPENGGTVSPAGTAEHNVGTNVEVTATAAEGYEFTGWSGASTAKTQSVTIIMSGNKALTANFEELKDAFIDSRDGKKYRTVKIGNKTWMAENLNFKAENSICHQKDEKNCQNFGRLYDWKTAMNGAASSSASPSGVQGVCPAGWHLPSESEWRAFVSFVGGEGTSGGNFDLAGFAGGFPIWWSATAGHGGASDALACGLDDYDNVELMYLNRKNKSVVRCIKN